MRNRSVVSIDARKIQNVSPVFYFDLADYNRLGGTPTEVQDVSGNYFAYPKGTDGAQSSRSALPVYASASNVQTGWTAGDTSTYTFLQSDSRCFYVENSNSIFDEYADVFNTSCFLIWGRFKAGSIGGTTGQNTLFSVRGYDGVNNQLISLEYSDGAASEQRARLRINNNNGIETIAGVDDDFNNTTDFHNVICLVDARAGVGESYLWFDGTLKNSPAISAGNFVFGSDNSNQGIGVGCDKSGASPTSFFNAEAQRIGMMNFQNGPPSDIANIVAQLNAHNCVPGRFMDGI